MTTALISEAGSNFLSVQPGLAGPGVSSTMDSIAQERRPLALLFTASSKYQFVYNSNITSDHVVVDGYDVLYDNASCYKLWWLYNILIEDKKHVNIPSMWAHDAIPLPGNILIQKRNEEDITIEDFISMINLRLPNPSERDKRELRKLMEDVESSEGCCTIL